MHRTGGTRALGGDGLGATTPSIAKTVKCLTFERPSPVLKVQGGAVLLSKAPCLSSQLDSITVRHF
jgi:hypothetical protein